MLIDVLDSITKKMSLQENKLNFLYSLRFRCGVCEFCLQSCVDTWIELNTSPLTLMNVLVGLLVHFVVV